jgi:pyruvate dehydrogenase E2 component (dihydrolipoamide acetyltransferase)
MSFVFQLPEVGEGVVEAEVIAWHVNVGDVVAENDPLCEITTDKAQLEISSPKSGRILKLHGEPGDIIRVHTPLVEIDESANTAATPASNNGMSTGPAAPPTAAPPTPPPVAPPAPAHAAAAPAAPSGPAKATPAVRRHAREAGIDIHDVSGTGRGGRVTHDDLSKHSAPTPMTAEMPLPKAPPALPQVMPSGTEERIKIIGIRRKIAEQMVKSKHTAPHFTYVEEIDCTKLVELRNSLKVFAAERGVKLTYIPLMMKACSIAMRQFPNVNAVMDEERFELVVKGDHNFGISCDTPNGLYVPVIKNVEQKSILHIAAEMADLVERTRTGKAKLDELRGGTFTLTSVGSIGGAFATPILNVPEVAILGVNAIRDAAVVRDGEIVIRKMMYLSPSFDHRVIDGAIGARFIAHLKHILEHPESLLLELK